MIDYYNNIFLKRKNNRFKYIQAILKFIKSQKWNLS